MSKRPEPYVVYLDEVRYRLLCEGDTGVVRAELWQPRPFGNFRYAVRIVPVGRITSRGTTGGAGC